MTWMKLHLLVGLEFLGCLMKCYCKFSPTYHQKISVIVPKFVQNGLRLHQMAVFGKNFILSGGYFEMTGGLGWMSMNHVPAMMGLVMTKDNGIKAGKKLVKEDYSLG